MKKLDEWVQLWQASVPALRPRKAYIRGWELEITLHALPPETLEEALDTPLSPTAQARRIVYAASPQLREAALPLLEAGKITDGPDILAGLTQAELRALLEQVLILSGVIGDSRVVIDPEDCLKNG